MRLTEQQKRVIRENPHLQSGKLAILLVASQASVDSYKYRNNIRVWTYRGFGIPFLRFDFQSKLPCYRVEYKGSYIFGGFLSVALFVVDHLIWCIENNMFNKPRIEHPYFDNLKIGDKNL